MSRKYSLINTASALQKARGLTWDSFLLNPYVYQMPLAPSFYVMILYDPYFHEITLPINAGHDELFIVFNKSDIFVIDTTKRLMSSLKCRSVEVINNLVRPGSSHREVNYINYK
jgi:hypothetical protein